MERHGSTGDGSHLEYGRDGRHREAILVGEEEIHGVEFGHAELAVIDEHFADHAAEVLARDGRVAKSVAVAPAEDSLPGDRRIVRHVVQRRGLLAEDKPGGAGHAIDEARRVGRL